MRLESKNITLTGASSGIGLELLKLLANFKGTRIVAIARNIESIPKLDGVIYPFKADIGKQEEIDALFEYASNTLGKIDIFIANAGFAYMEELGKPDWVHNKSIFDVNTLSPIYSLQKFEQLNNETEQYFVCVSSVVAEVALPYYSLYCSTKSAISHFLDTYRFEARKSLRIACVYPIATKTAFFKRATNEQNPTMPFLTQDAITVARSIVKGIERNKKKIYPSKLYKSFRFLGRLFPSLYNIYSKREKRKVDQKKI